MTRENESHVTGRRTFLTQLSAAAVAGVGLSGTVRAEDPKPATPAGTLAKITLGKYQVTRLIVGANPLHGYSYQGPHTDRHMKEYFTVERTVEFLQQCEHEGINTFQFSPGTPVPESLRILREKGSKLHTICLHSDSKGITSMIDETQPMEAPEQSVADYPRMKVLVETQLQRRRDQSSTAIAIVRPGILYNDQRPPAKKVIRALGRNWALIVGKGHNHLPFVHTRDVAELILRAADDAGPGPAVPGRAPAELEAAAESQAAGRIVNSRAFSDRGPVPALMPR
jgi:hypothetical protein